ncbi:DDE-type integrase/transposase/recombinase [Undibacterium arcticum]
MTRKVKTVDFLLTASRDKELPCASLARPCRIMVSLKKIAMDKSGANKAAIDEINAGREIPMVVRQVKYLNNIVEQDHRAIKHVTRSMLNFKSFRLARNVFAGIPPGVRIVVASSD